MTLSREATHDNGDDASDPLTWDAWTDEWNWVPSLPYDEDDDAAGLDVENDPAYLAWLDSLAASSATLDRLERSMIPPDVAAWLIADSIIHNEDQYQHLCICEKCITDRTARYAD